MGYVRLHGRNYEQWFDSDSRNDRYNYLYTDPELRSWKTRIDTIAEKAEKTFVIANNHFEGKALVNALQLKNMVTGRSVHMPEMLLERYWELGEIVARKGRRRRFVMPARLKPKSTVTLRLAQWQVNSTNDFIPEQMELT